MSSRLRTLLLALLGVALITGPASASPEEVVRDFRDHRQEITKRHSWSDLRASVALMRSEALDDRSLQEQFTEEVQRVIARDHLGLAEPPPATMDPARLPSWVVALATATFILIATGITAAIWRRIRPLR